MSFIACELRIKISAETDRAIDSLISAIRREGGDDRELIEVRIFENPPREWVQ